MKRITKAQRQAIIDSSPVGTWTLMLFVGVGMVIGWLFFYYGVFMPRGMIN